MTISNRDIGYGRQHKVHTGSAARSPERKAGRPCDERQEEQEEQEERERDRKHQDVGSNKRGLPHVRKINEYVLLTYTKKSTRIGSLSFAKLNTFYIEATSAFKIRP